MHVSSILSALVLALVLIAPAPLQSAAAASLVAPVAAVTPVAAPVVEYVPASGPWPGCEYCMYQNQATFYCLDDSEAYGLRSIPCNGLSWQRWRFKILNPPASGPISLQNLATQRCLDKSEVGLRTLPCNGLIYQRIGNPGTKIIDFRPASAIRFFYDDSCLDQSFQFNLRTFDCNFQNYQIWRNDDW